MELLPYFLIGVGLLIAAIFDSWKKKVPDLVTGCLWAFLFLDGVNHQAAIFGFATVFLFNTLVVYKYNAPLLAWGDILGFPAYYASFVFFYSVAPETAVMGIFGFFAPMPFSYFYKEKMPVYPFWVFSFIMALAFVVSIS